MRLDWDKLVKERDEWVARNFPEQRLDTPVDESLIGVIEEVGELAHAHLKAAQGIRGSEEEHIKNAKDAIGDITIYLLGVISFMGGGFENEGIRPVNFGSTPTWSLKYLADNVGKLALSPDLHQCYNIVRCLISYCEFAGWDYEGIVTTTWERVKQRDWQANPKDGNVPIGQDPKHRAPLGVPDEEVAGRRYPDFG